MSAQHDTTASRQAAERLLYGVGIVAALAIAAGLVWLALGGMPAHWLGYVVAILVAAGLASIRLGALGIGLLATALAAFIFGLPGLLGGIVLTVLLLLARR
ncbi:hypothetical protein [Mesorhizobium sp.]|uniref:hypothetical protein n=1 Tax=Mesorhizobium sp. TaxID=1871066 RepID=UPI000FE8EF01|nr:hypothetical protein [Mesorhizobium sp.]RWE37442.1 MAG: hypothetical protein EOS77_02360 [Mesorhizobium sp.]